MKKPRKARVAAQVDDSFKEQIMAYCDAVDEPLSRMIRRLLKEEMARNPISGGKEDGTNR